MNLREWWSFYSLITEDFLFDPRKDYLASLKLSSILYNSTKTDLSEVLRGKEVTIFGNGRDLDKALDSATGDISVVADSAIATYLGKKNCPDIIVTDLDGDLDMVMSCARSGTTVVIHAHGDNMHKFSKIPGDSIMKAVGTTQNIPLWNIFNFGGFTDGDRAAFMADSFGAERITLVGFDFEHPNPAKHSDLLIKKRKLKWARTLLQYLAESRGTVFHEGNFIEI